ARYQHRSAVKPEGAVARGRAGGGDDRWPAQALPGDRSVMTQDQRRALEALRFNWAPVADDVWRPAPFHVEGLHRTAELALLRGLDDARTSIESSPIGLILQGQRGAGKTHLLGWGREQVQRHGGYFFLVSLLDAAGFWASVVQSIDE